MIADLPAFDLGEHFREQSPVEAKRKWRWIGTVQNKLPLAFDTGVHCAFLDERNIERGRLLGDHFVNHSDYAWNGCSPKRWVPFFGWIGTPDHPLNLQASYWHDFLTQMIDTKHFPFSQVQVDEIFLQIMLQRRYQWAGLYHGAVRDFGGQFKRVNECRSVLLKTS